MHKTKAITVERSEVGLNDNEQQMDELEEKLYDNKNEQTDDTSSEIIRLQKKLSEAEHLANEYKAQLHTQTLQASANNSKNHLSELELERVRLRLQKRIAELEPLPKLLKQAETKNDYLQKHVNELEKRSSVGLNFTTQTSLIDRTNDNCIKSDDDDDGTFQQYTILRYFPIFFVVYILEK